MKWTIIVPSKLGIDKPNQVLSQYASTFPICFIAWSKWCKSQIFAWKLPSIHSNTAHTQMKSTLQGASHSPLKPRSKCRTMSHVGYIVGSCVKAQNGLCVCQHETEVLFCIPLLPSWWYFLWQLIVPLIIIIVTVFGSDSSSVRNIM